MVVQACPSSSSSFTPLPNQLCSFYDVAREGMSFLCLQDVDRLPSPDLEKLYSTARIIKRLVGFFFFFF